MLSRSLLPLLCLLSGACSNPPYPRGSVEQLYAGPPRPQLQTLQGGARPIHYAQVAQAGTPRIVFIHGSPGDWQAWARYLDHEQLRDLGSLVAPDRPGFGGSGAHRVIPSLQQQAALLAPLLDDAGGPSIVVGHSLGGAVALRLAVDYPERVRGVLLIAASVAPELESPRWYNELASWRAVQWLIPAELTDSNRELYGLKPELEALDRDLVHLRAPVYVMQGEQDQLVDPRTADYLEERLAAMPHRLFRYADQGHFVLWKRPEEVVRVLRELVAQTAPR